MSRPACPQASRPRGFTLIEVIAALVIFSVGVLMVIQLSGALGVQMRYAGARSELVALVNERLDSLEAAPFASVTTGITTYNVTVAGIPYQGTVTVTELTAVLTQIDVSLASVAGDGPSHDVTSYTSVAW